MDLRPCLHEGKRGIFSHLCTPQVQFSLPSTAKKARQQRGERSVGGMGHGPILTTTTMTMKMAVVMFFFQRSDFRGENVIAKDPNSDSSTLCRKKSVVALIGITPVHPPPKASPYGKKSVVAWSGVPPLTPEPLRRKKEKSAYLKGGLRRQGGGEGAHQTARCRIWNAKM